MVLKKYFNAAILRILRKNCGGFALLYVMGALLIVTFLGSALINISQKDVVSATDYSAMTTAAISAKSSMQACEAMFEHQPQDVVDKLNNYLDAGYTAADKEWLQGSDDNPVVLDNQQKYCVKITGFDKNDYVIQLEGTGLGKGGSKKKVTGIYDLGGIDFITETYYTGTLDRVVYFEGNISIQAPITIDGDFYSNQDMMFTDWSTGCVFQGSFMCMGDAEIRGQQTFNDVAYFGGDVMIRQGGVAPGTGSIFNDRSGFEQALTRNASDVGAFIEMQNDTYLKGTTPYQVINDLHGNTYFHDGSVTHGNIVNGNPTLQATMNVPASLGLTAPAAPQFNASAIPGSIMYTLVHLEHYSASDFHDFWQDASNNGKLWNSYVVCKTDAGADVTIKRGSSTFQDSIIILNDGALSVTGVPSDIGWPNCALTSVTIIYNTGDLNWGQNIGYNDTFRGYIFNDPSSNTFFVGQAASVKLNRVVGGIHDMNTTNGLDWHPDDAHHVTNLEMDGTLFIALSGIGLAGTGGVVVNETTTLEFTEAQLSHTRLGLCF